MAKKIETKTEVKPAETTVVSQLHQNGITRPKSGTKTGLVWEIADKISAELQKPAPRKSVLEAAQKEDINVATATTQYGRWRKFNGLVGKGTEEEEAPAASAPTAEADEADVEDEDEDGEETE